MHVNIQHRFNAATGSEDMYYSLVESYRDVRGRVHSLIVLNIGFEPGMRPTQIRRIATALSLKLKTRGQNMLFDSWADGLSDMEREKAEPYWKRMINEEMLDRFDKRETEAKGEGYHHKPYRPPKQRE